MSEWDTFIAAEKEAHTARAELITVAENLEGIAEALRKDPARLTRPNPNFTENLIDEPKPFDLMRLPNHNDLHKMAMRVAEADKKLAAAKAALPADMRARLTTQPRR